MEIVIIVLAAASQYSGFIFCDRQQLSDSIMELRGDILAMLFLFREYNFQIQFANLIRFVRHGLLERCDCLSRLNILQKQRSEDDCHY